MMDSTGRRPTEGGAGGVIRAALAIALLFLGVGARVEADPVCNGTCRYASATGSGTGCTFAAPCSLDYAINSIHTSPASNLHIVLLDDGGTYWRTQPIALTVNDSGTPSSPVSIEAGRNEKPVISGGTPVTGWQLFDPTKNIWRAPVAAGSASRQLYVNGTRAQRARGYFHANFVGPLSYGYDLAGFPLNWAHKNELEIVALGQWKTVRCPVSDLTPNQDGSTRITLETDCWQSAPCGQYFCVGKPDWVENAYELIDEPGEWYLERAAVPPAMNPYLYYKPRAGETMATAEVILPRLGTPLFRAGDYFNPDVHDIVLSGLTFTHTSWTYADATHGYVPIQAGIVGPPGYKPTAALQLWADALQVKGCTFEHLGGAGLAIENPSSDVHVEGNVFRDIASDAVMVGDIFPPPSPGAMSGNVVSNNYITEIGRDYYDAAGIFVGVARDTTVSHNELRNLPYGGIDVGWYGDDPPHGYGNMVESNLEASVVQRLWDGGAVYTQSPQADSTITRNVLHTAIGGHEASESVFGVSATGIYLDSGTQHYLAENNLVGSTPTWGFIQSGILPYATNNTVQNNFSDTSAFGCDAFCAGNNNVVTGNQVFAPGAVGNFPPGAWVTMGGAGIEPSFASTRPTLTKVEAEDYDEGAGGSYDTTSGNSYGNYRQGDVDVSFCSTCSNDHFVQAAATEWLRYYVDAPSGGVYDIGFRVATADASSSIQLLLDGAAIKTVALPNTGGLTQWQTVTFTGYPIPKGPHILQLLFAGGPRLDYFTTTLQASPCPTGGAQPSKVLTGDFDGNPQTGPETLRVYTGTLCWDVAGSPLSTATAWLSGWGSGNYMAKGDFDGDGHDDVLVIYQNQSQWHWSVALSTGYRFEQRPDTLLGWGNGNQTLIGDFDGDGKDDATVIYYYPVDGQWHWNFAQSTGNGAFAPYTDAQVGYGNGNGACVKNVDADAADEIVIQWSPSNYCANLDGSHHFVVTTCSATCP